MYPWANRLLLAAFLILPVSAVVAEALVIAAAACVLPRWIRERPEPLPVRPGRAR